MGYVGSVENDLNLGSVPDVLGGGTQDFTWWRFLAWVLLPLPVVLVVLLSAPAPRLVRRGVLRFVETLLVARVRGPIEIIHFALLIAGLSVTFCIGPMLSSEAEVAKLENRRDPNILVMLLARQYRNERNFWLALFTLSSWAVLWVVYQVNRDKHVLRGKLLALQGKGAAAADEVAFLGNDSARRLERAGDNVAATRPAGTSRPTVDGIVKKDL
ncbi:hypothetical protein ACKKBF_B15260 [Auxenochlorella protothecoides x Auxenochlorella symbiontica]|uniref:BAP29/BAP31 transmembrane domain-containing protein n=1 Tax=Auxenochlorella protothecoides TaxID=3075 RepID=A0A3M7L4F9_AUXPR|nr:hypothetical protein APUTEX25_001818 [Auxenochlorella protothecoides]|eukprot:RMZ57618.1 hypothetical protein APUTEX25_001818 [Auxenochlorella protothecoides]